MYSCCQRVVACIEWRRANDRCPLCNKAPPASIGFDDVTRLISCERPKGSDACTHAGENRTDSDNGEDFEPMCALQPFFLLGCMLLALAHYDV